MNFIEYILAPFVFIIREVFLFSYSLTGNYGVSVILLSFFISLILLPIFILIERSKKRNDAVKLRMKPLLDEIRRCYRGQERYYYIRTLHRQHGFSSFRSLIPILSLLLQIPFFIAAYQFLEHYEPLAGQRFLMINDLSAPDGLLGSINLLPIFMTLVNLLTAYFYTRCGDISERRQMLVVAGVFLVLLYNFPSGLVLYWTMNNVFSFFRLFITNPEVFRRPVKTIDEQKFVFADLKFRSIAMLPKLYRTFLVVVVVFVVFQINRAFRHDFNDIAIRILLSVVSGAAIVILLAALALTHKIHLPQRRLNPKAFLLHLLPVFKPMLIVITSLLILSQLKWALEYNFNDFALRMVVSVLSGSMITLLLSLAVLYLQDQFSIKPVKFRTNIFRMAPGFRMLFWSMLLLAVFSQINWAFQYNFKDIVFRLLSVVLISWLITIITTCIAKTSRVKVNYNLRKTLESVYLPSWLYISMLVITTYFYFGSKFYFGGINHDLGAIAIVAMVISQFTGLIYFINNFRKLNRIWSGIASVVLSLVTVFQLLVTWAIIAGSDISMLKINISGTEGTLIDVVLPGILFISIIALFIYGRSVKRDPSMLVSNWPIYMLSLLYLLGFIFLWNPVAVYASYPSNFEFTAFDIIKNNLLPFAAALLIFTATYFILRRKARYILLILLISTVVLSFIHNTIVPIRVGTLQDAVFLKQDNLAKPVSLFLLEAIGMLGIFFGVKWFIDRGYHKQFRYALLALNLILITQSLVVAGSSGSFFKKENIPPDPSSSISFSKEKENIVLLILDMFHGWYVNRAVEENPELKNLYDGFVWYPNTLAVSNITGSTIGPILGGYRYTIDKLNQDKDQLLEQKITGIASDFNKEIREKGYRYSGNHIIYTKDDSLTYDTFLPKWHEQWNDLNYKLNIGLDREVGYSLLWSNAAFYSAPLIFKPRIYNQGQWFLGKVETNENTSRTMPYNFLRLLPFISNANSTRPNFMYLYSSATHHPWDIIDENGIIQADVTPYENNKWALETLSDWIHWMKKNEVYDNTKIIIVSDHGPHWWSFKGEVDTNIPVIPNARVKKINEASMGLFALMLVKDFHSQGELKEDWRFMSNADVSAIIFNENDPTKVEPPLLRTLPTSEVLWERRLWELNQLRIIKQFEVTDNMYDLNNWKVVD
ncbi:MAG: membrane protein insertase YidC [Bacteroidales bacterium]